MKTADELTVDDLKKAFTNLTKNEAEIALALMQRRLVGNFFSSVERWVNKCYHKPRKDDRRLEALNQLLEGHGTEGITPDGECSPKMAYVNMGDTYITTVIHDLERDEFLLGCWGDWLEKWEEENPREVEEAEAEAEEVE
jgi:hypothetical protein